MKDKAFSAIRAHQMILQGDRVTAGVSGGADSVALLDFLHSVREELGFSLFACHVNHCLRGEESDRDERFVRELCKRLGVRLIVKRVDAASCAKENGLSVEEAARKVRYMAFREAVLEQETAMERPDGGRIRIALAHTLSDSAETALLNLARGTGLRGLCGIPPVRDEIIRPLIDCTRAEVETYLAMRGLDFVTDSSNLSDVYGRNRLRHAAVPVLKTLNPSFEAVFAREAKSFSEDEDCLSALAEAALRDAWGLGGFRLSALRPLHRAVALRALRAFLIEAGLPYDTRRLELVWSLVQSGSGAVEITGGRYVSVRKGHLVLETASSRAAADITPPEAKTILLPPLGECVRFPWTGGKSLSIAVFSGKEAKKIRKCNSLVLTNMADYDKITKILTLRGRQEGDRFYPARGGGGKSIKKLCQERGILPEERAGLALLCDGEQIVWMERCGVSQQVVASEATEQFVLFHVVGVEDQESRGRV